MARDSVGIRWYRRLLRRAPDDFRRAYADDAARALADLLAAERRRAGRLAAGRVWLRAMIDGARTARRERRTVMRGAGLFTGLGDDLIYIVRSWRHAKTFALTAVLTIGLGLGLNAGIFSFADGFLFRPLPFEDPDRLFALGETGTLSGGLNLDDYDEIVRERPALAGLAEWDTDRGLGGRLQVGDRWFDPFVYSVSPHFEDVMGFRLLMGRGFRDDEHQPGAVTPCWLSYEYWRTAFGADPGVLGRRLVVATDDRRTDVEVVGVLPPTVASFDLNNTPPDMVTPRIPRVVTGKMRQFATAFPMVRLAPGVTPEIAQARLQAVVDAVQQQTPGGAHRTIRLRSLREQQVRGGRPTAWLLFAVGLAILLLVIVNLGHLLLARAVTRASEVAVRLALGASRWRIVRLLLAESTTIAGGGLLLGLGLGWMCSRLLQAYVPKYPTAGRNMSLVPFDFDHRAWLFTAALASLAALAASIVPAWWRSSATGGRVVRALAGLREGLRGRTARAILTAEVALATTILTGTTLVGVSAWRFLHQPLGFDPSHKEAFSVTPPRGGPTPSPRVLSALRATLAKVPGVAAVSLADDRGSSTVVVDGRPLKPSVASATRVDANYFDVLGVRLLQGRGFTAAEGDSDAPVAVIDADLARRLWPGGDALGRTIGDGSATTRTVVGVVAHLRWRLAADTPQTLYIPLDPTRPVWAGFVSTPNVSTEQAISNVSRAAGSVVGAGRAGAFPLSTRISLRDAGEYRFQGPIVAILGAVAFLLTGVGLYGLVTYLVEQRIREFGVRLALGARRLDLWRAVLRQSVAPAIGGTALGLGISLWTNRLLESLLFGVTPTSPGVLAVVASSLLAAAVLASIRPARRVLRIDPVQVLRAE